MEQRGLKSIQRTAILCSRLRNRARGCLQGCGKLLVGSTDGGFTWNGDSSILNCTVIRSLVKSPVESGNNYLFAGTDSGVFRSSDNGVSWASKTPGFNSQFILTLLFYKDQEFGNIVLLAGTGAGIYSSTDYGETWNATGVPPAKWYLTALGSNIFAGSTSQPYGNLGIGVEDRCEIYRSNNFGLTWTEVDQDLVGRPNSMLISLASFPDAVNGFNLFAGAAGSYMYGYGFVFESSDLGATWVNAIADSLVAPDPTVFATSSDIFIGTRESGMCRSTDYGLTWTVHDSGMTMPPWGGYIQSSVNAFRATVPASMSQEGIRALLQPQCDILQLHNGFNRQRRELVAHRIGIFTAFNDSRLRYNFSPQVHLRFGFKPADWDARMGLRRDVPDGSPAPPMGGGVYHSVNNGSAWKLINTALIGKQVYSIVSDKSSTFAAATGSGVFRSTDNGTTWTNINEGLTDSSVTALLVADPYLLVATTSGVWRRPLSEISSVDPGRTSPESPGSTASARTIRTRLIRRRRD